MQYPLLNLSDYRFSILKCFYSFMLWIMGYWFTHFEDKIFNTAHLDFITAHSSCTNGQCYPPYFRPWLLSETSMQNFKWDFHVT